MISIVSVSECPTVAVHSYVMLMYAPAGFPTDLNSCLLFLQYFLSALLEKGGGVHGRARWRTEAAPVFLTAAL